MRSSSTRLRPGGSHGAQQQTRADERRRRASPRVRVRPAARARAGDTRLCSGVTCCPVLCSAAEEACSPCSTGGSGATCNSTLPRRAETLARRECDAWRYSRRGGKSACCISKWMLSRVVLRRAVALSFSDDLNALRRRPWALRACRSPGGTGCGATPSLVRTRSQFREESWVRRVCRDAPLALCARRGHPRAPSRACVQPLWRRALPGP